MENLEIWDKVKQPPSNAIKNITGGRLKGMSDISPQWRFFAMTDAFGPVGIGWKYTIDKQWVEVGDGVERCAMTNISLHYKHGDDWSEAIPGTGGSAFVTKESKGPYTSDEAFKMSLTDALSVAMKALGVAANIYSGNQDYTKYTTPEQTSPQAQSNQSSTSKTTKTEGKDWYNTFNEDRPTMLAKLDSGEHKNPQEIVELISADFRINNKVKAQILALYA